MVLKKEELELFFFLAVFFESGVLCTTRTAALTTTPTVGLIACCRCGIVALIAATTHYRYCY